MREVEKCWGPGSLSEGLDAVLCKPMPLQGFSEPEARRYREVEPGLQTVRPLESGFYPGNSTVPWGLCLTSLLALQFTTSPEPC